MNHFLSTTHWTPGELDALLETAAAIKAGKNQSRLTGKVMGMVFFNPSLRTRTSFEAGMFQLGGHAVNLSVGDGMWKLEEKEGVVMDGDAAEHVKEAVPVLSRYVDVLGVRAFAQGKDWQIDKQDPVLTSFAKYSEVPVVNMESAVWHPCQALADALTWKEANVKKKDKIVLTWAYHPRALPLAVPNSVLVMAAARGLSVTVLRPNEFALPENVMEQARTIAQTRGGCVEESDDPNSLQGAKIVYAKSWGSLQAYGNKQQEAASRSKYKHWQVTKDWMQKTDDAKFMHCLPVRRNVVVEDDVLDSNSSIVISQAENRLHAQKALLLKLLSQ